MGVAPHPRVAGMDFDFSFVYGPAAPVRHRRRVGLMEYDGLGAARLSDLGFKLDRHALLKVLGVRIVWAGSTAYEHIRDQIIDPQPPPVVTKSAVCPVCRGERSLIVANWSTPLGDAQGDARDDLMNIEEHILCDACRTTAGEGDAQKLSE